MSEKNQFLTVKQFAVHFPAFSEGSLRYLIFNATTNGFVSCLRRIGRKILIDVNAFNSWVQQQGGDKI